MPRHSGNTAATGRKQKRPGSREDHGGTGRFGWLDGTGRRRLRACERVSAQSWESCWYAGDDPWQSCYGPQMTLATDARRFDVSPAWPAWVGARVALEFFASLDLEEVRSHDAGLGDALCRGLGVAANAQSIVTWADADGRDLAALAAAGITASGRAGRARVAFHLWNDQTDVDAVRAALGRG